MMKTFFTSVLSLFVCVASFTTGLSQTTTVTTGIPSSATTLSAVGLTPGISFIVSNTNAFPMILTSMQVYRDAASSGKTWSLYYSATSLSGPSNINAAAGWTLITTAVAPTASSTAIHPVFPTLNFQIPANTIYRFYVCHSGDIFNYGSAASTPNNFSNGGMTIGTGNYLISGQNVGHAGYSASLSTAFVPRFFGGTLTFQPGSANNLHGLSISQPAGNSSNCFGALLPVRVIFQNTGSAAQSNFQVGASYTGVANGNVTGIYTGTLAPGAIDSIDLGLVNLQPGSYSLKAYTMLATDTLNNNDTTADVSFQINQPVAVPVTLSDTVCQGNNAFVTVVPVVGAQYKWYSAATGGSVVHIGSNVSFTNLTQDTTMYISSTINGCESGRMPAHAAIGPAPVVNLGSDTSFCESLPLILDAGNPGGKYTWSTGDSTRAITVTNVSGTYWVTVDKYCATSDTVDVTIAPMPLVLGISWVRMNNTYHFTPTNPQHVQSYMWIFGDGNTSTDPNPVHTFQSSHSPFNVKLVVTNNCGSDTVNRSVTTPVDELGGLEEAITVFPNPASDVLVIHSPKLQINELVVINMTGSVVATQKVDSQHEARMDVQRLPSGNYIIRLLTNGGEARKLIQVFR